MVAGGEILKVLRGDMVILEGKKRMRGHYYLAESSGRGRASGARRSSERGGALGGSGSGTRCEVQEDERRYRKVKFLLLQDDTPSRS